MVRTPKQRSRPNGHAAGRAEVAITQAQYMLEIYAEILAMDKAIIERIRQVIVRQSDNGDREADLTNLRLILAQLQKIGQRIAYWNARLRSLVQLQLLPRAGSQGTSYRGVDK
jgi:hypothetical protein